MISPSFMIVVFVVFAPQSTPAVIIFSSPPYYPY
jgi:hypothetical protein